MTEPPRRVYYDGNVQVVEWDERTVSRSWPLSCNNCGHTTADYWEKERWSYLPWSDDPEMSWHLCSERCAAEWIERGEA
jgi:hypothetical protein